MYSGVEDIVFGFRPEVDVVSSTLFATDCLYDLMLVYSQLSTMASFWLIRLSMCRLMAAALGFVVGVSGSSLRFVVVGLVGVLGAVVVVVVELV